MNSHANASNGASGDCVKAYEVLSENLIHQLGDEMVLGLQMMLMQAKELVNESRGYSSDAASVMFQALEAVHDWSGLILMAETQRIVQNKPTLPTINAAAMVAGTQVLFAIRPIDYNDESRGTFDLKAPDMSVLVHWAYRIVAIELMHRIEESAALTLKHISHGNIDVRNLCRDAVKEAIPRTLPLNDIIKYLMGDDVGRLVTALNDQIRNAIPSNNSDKTGDDETSARPAVAAGMNAIVAPGTTPTAGGDDDDDVADDEARLVTGAEAASVHDDADEDDPADDDDASLASDVGSDRSGSGSGGDRESDRSGHHRNSYMSGDRDNDRDRRNSGRDERQRDDSMYYRDRDRARNDDQPKKRRFF